MGITPVLATSSVKKDDSTVKPKAKGKPVGPAVEYWRTMTKAMSDARKTGEEAMKRSYLRELPSQNECDPFPWTGTCIREQTLAHPDPDDEDFVKGYQWLQQVALEIKHKSKEKAPRKMEDCGEDYIAQLRDKAMIEGTGKTQADWDIFVVSMQEQNSPWDFSSIQVRQVPHKREGLSRAGVFATVSLQQKADGVETVFNVGDVIGPLGGVLRRRSRYEAMYYADRKWILHDPACYELSLRIQTTELKLETLCLDLKSNGCLSRNRLAYLADSRPDPLYLRAVLQMEPEAGPRSVLPPRNRMPRPRSRPGSPESPGGRTKDLTAMPITAQTMQAAPDDKGTGANVKRAEVLVDGYPHVFVIATKDIKVNEELVVDHGEDYWASQRAMLTRLLEIGRLGHETVVRVNRDEGEQQNQADEEPAFEMPARNRMKRVKEDV